MSKYYTDRYGRIRQKSYIIEIIFLSVLALVLLNMFIKATTPQYNTDNKPFTIYVEHSGIILEN